MCLYCIYYKYLKFFTVSLETSRTSFGRNEHKLELFCKRVEVIQVRLNFNMNFDLIMDGSIFLKLLQTYK